MRREVKTDALESTLGAIAVICFILIISIAFSIIYKKLFPEIVMTIICILGISIIICAHLFIYIIKIEIKGEKIFFLTHFKIKKSYSIRNLVKVVGGYVNGAYVLHFNNNTEGIYISKHYDEFFQMIRDIADWKRKNIGKTEGVIYRQFLQKDVKL